jgi:hypothetical protein
MAELDFLNESSSRSPVRKPKVEQRSIKRFVIVTALCCLVLCGGAFALGYYVGHEAMRNEMRAAFMKGFGLQDRPLKPGETKTQYAASLARQAAENTVRDARAKQAEENESR